MSETEAIGVVPRSRSKGSWPILARKLGMPVGGLRKRYGGDEGREALNAAYEAPGSLWRIHPKGERYAVDIKLPDVEAGDKVAAAQRLIAAGLDCSWIVPAQVPAPSADIVLFRPAAAVKQRKYSLAARKLGQVT